MTSFHIKHIDFASCLLPLLSIINKKFKNKKHGFFFFFFFFFSQSDSSSTEIHSKTLPDYSWWRIYTSTALAERALIHFSNYFLLDRRFIIPAIILSQRQGAFILVRQNEYHYWVTKNPITQESIPAVILQSNNYIKFGELGMHRVSKSLPEYGKHYLCSGCILNAKRSVCNHVIQSCIQACSLVPAVHIGSQLGKNNCYLQITSDMFNKDCL